MAEGYCDCRWVHAYHPTGPYINEVRLTLHIGADNQNRPHRNEALGCNFNFCHISSWFDQYEEKRWDRQIERDQLGGPLRTLMDKARADFKAGKCTRL